MKGFCENSFRLKLLRKLQGKNQQEFAEFTGVVQPIISYCESGKRPLSVESKIKIAHACKVSVDFFDIPDEELPREKIHFRKLASDSVKNTDFILANFHEIYRIATLLHDETKKSILQLTAQSLETWDDDDIEEIAQKTRTELEVTPGNPVHSLMRRIEQAGIYVAPLIEENSDFFLSGHSGLSISHHNLSVIGYVPESGDRQRLTLAHELGHLILHKNPSAHYANFDYRTQIKTQEKEAMHFASALLYPKEQAYKDISESLNLTGYARLKAQWGISIQALIRRAKDLHLITQDRYKYLMIQISAKGWRKQEPVLVEPEKPALLWYLLTEKFGSNPYFLASQKFASSPDFLKTWIPSDQTPHKNNLPDKKPVVISLLKQS